MKKHTLWIKALATTLLAVPAVYILILNPFENMADFSMAVFYIRTANRTRLTTLCKDNVILSLIISPGKELLLLQKKPILTKQNLHRMHKQWFCIPLSSF